MLIFLLVCVIFSLGFWAYMALSPAQRMMPRFIYGEGISPDTQNGLFRGDDVNWPYAGDPVEWPRVTVVVPGRNEGHLLERTLGSICAMDYPHLQVIFVDDQSTDNTREICALLRQKFPNLHVLHNQEPPRDGWVGKTWAVHLGLEQPAVRDADLLLFTDSDLVFQPAALKQAVRLMHHRKAELVSLLPKLEAHTLGELLGLLAGMSLVCVALPIQKINNPKYPKGLGAGGFMLWQKAAYEKIGGHAAIRGQMIEDIALTRLAKTKGVRTFTTFSGGLYSARMYEGWRDTFHGLKKNAYAGAMYSPIKGIASLLAMFFGMVLVPIYVGVGTFLWITQPSPLTFVICLLAFISMSCSLTASGRSAQVLGFKKITGWLMPLAMAFYMVIFTASMLDHHRGGNIWSGRRVATKERLDQIR